LAKEALKNDSGGPAPRRRLLLAAAAGAFLWFFLGGMIDPRSAFWVISAGVAVMALAQGVLSSTYRQRLVRGLSFGLASGLGLDLVVRGMPLFLANHRWDWLAEVFISTAIACLAAAIGGACSMLVRGLFRPRAV
jgi:hypothetical protein